MSTSTTIVQQHKRIKSWCVSIQFIDAGCVYESAKERVNVERESAVQDCKPSDTAALCSAWLVSGLVTGLQAPEIFMIQRRRKTLCPVNYVGTQIVIILFFV